MKLQSQWRLGTIIARCWLLVAVCCFRVGAIHTILISQANLQHAASDQPRRGWRAAANTRRWRHDGKPDALPSPIPDCAQRRECPVVPSTVQARPHGRDDSWFRVADATRSKAETDGVTG